MNGDSYLRCVAACPPEHVKKPPVVSPDRPIKILPPGGKPMFCCIAKADGSVELVAMEEKAA